MHWHDWQRILKTELAASRLLEEFHSMTTKVTYPDLFYFILAKIHKTYNR
jgi:hypothetical protein